METYNLKKDDIKIHNIVYAITSEQDYEMSRYILLEKMPGCSYDEYVIAEGYHCSCYDFDDTKWEATKYNKDDLKRLAQAHIDKNDLFYKEEKCLYNYIVKYIK